MACLHLACLQPPVAQQEAAGTNSVAGRWIWAPGEDEADLKSLEKQLNLLVTCYSGVSKWYVGRLTFGLKYCL